MRPALGHVHLRVRELERSVAFYRRFVGLEIRERVGERYVFLGGDSRHHELALEAVAAHALPDDGEPAGLARVAFELPDRGYFARAYQELTEAEVPVEATDHGVRRSLTFRDPDGHGVELYVDTRHDRDGRPRWRGWSRPLSAAAILAGAWQSREEDPFE